MKAFRCDRCKEFKAYSPQATIKSRGIALPDLELCYSCGRICGRAIGQALQLESVGYAAWERAEQNKIGRRMIRHEGQCTYRIRNEDSHDYYFECDKKQLHLDEEEVKSLITLLQNLKAERT